MTAADIMVDSVNNGQLVVPSLPAVNDTFDRLVDFPIQDLGRVGDLVVTIAELIGLISNGRNRNSCCGRYKEKTNQT